MDKINDAIPTFSALVNQFNYTQAQMDQLLLASEISTGLSMVAIVLIIAVYIYMLFYHPRDANRVSLRCVIGANVVTLVDHCIVWKLGYVTLDTTYCQAFRVLDGLFTIMSCCLLGVVGVHLFLVLVCHLSWPCRPEYILIPSCVVFTFIANVFSFTDEDLPAEFEKLIHADTRECWFYNAFLDRVYNRTSWIYYYSFMFLIIVVATLSSVSAMWKVYLDKRRNQRTMDEITARGIGAAVPDGAEYEHRESQVSQCHVHQHTSNPFTKVVCRSLFYPLMPALTYSTGFALQMYIVNPYHSVDFAFAMAGNVMARLAGVFTAIIFFIDPTVHPIPLELWKKCTKRIPLPT